jgi:hypothetical protein
MAAALPVPDMSLAMVCAAGRAVIRVDPAIAIAVYAGHHIAEHVVHFSLRDQAVAVCVRALKGIHTPVGLCRVKDRRPFFQIEASVARGIGLRHLFCTKEKGRTGI